MMKAVSAHDFASWRAAARQCLQRNISPDLCTWHDKQTAQLDLLRVPEVVKTQPVTNLSFNIPPAFLQIAEKVSCHSHPAKWDLLYRVLWRLTHGEKHALALSTDSEIRRMMVMAKQVSRDAHKAKAFIRFRTLGINEKGREQFAAWHCPDHNVLPLIAPFFQRRFGVMDWTIMSPQQTISWNGEALVYAPGVPKDQAPPEDAMEEVWRTFYRAIFNPARIKIKMMKQEMPIRYWHTLPETRIIADMLHEAPARVAEMIRHQEGFARSAEDFLPADRSIPTLRASATKCEGCPLHCNATQTVFGAGPERSRLMIVGEQPGEQEDKSGIPFIGPAGAVLMKLLAEAGITRDDAYVTNAVKHFKFTQSGEKRIHQSPSAREINACKPWLEAEREAIRPDIILGLGLTAAKSLLGHGFKMKDRRGQWFKDGDTNILITYHPSAVLRAMNDLQKREIYAHMLADIRTVQGLLK